MSNLVLVINRDIFLSIEFLGIAITFVQKLTQRRRILEAEAARAGRFGTPKSHIVLHPMRAIIFFFEILFLKIVVGKLNFEKPQESEKRIRYKWLFFVSEAMAQNFIRL